MGSDSSRPSSPAGLLVDASTTCQHSASSVDRVLAHYGNTLALLRDVANRMDFERLPLIVTDGFDFYEKVVRRVFGPAALYGQVLKTRRSDRIVKAERRALMGASWRFEEALNHSEDSSTLNTSFIERLNLTIRKGSAYLARRALSHARLNDKLEQHLELL